MTRDPPKSALLIRMNASGTHAEVLLADPAEPAPPGMHPLRPGDSHFAIPYALWARAADGTVDVLHLQALAERERAPVPIDAVVVSDDWREEQELSLPSVPGADVTSGYGFWTGSRLIGCSAERLVAQCVEVPETPRVWTPGSRGLVRPETVTVLVAALRESRRRAAVRTVVLAALALTLSAAFSIGSDARSGWAVVSALAAAWTMVALFQYRHVHATADQDAFASAREEFRHALWLGSRPARVTEMLLLLLALVFFVQTFDVASAIDAVGLVKPRVREGELWRLLTAPLLHGGLLHLGMNGLALWSLGPLVEAHARRGVLALLFLVAAVSGSAASLLLLPVPTSVGASGGILGIAGYLLLLGYRRREALPRGFVQRLGAGVMATAVLGIVGHAWVDNAMHLGGFIAGVILALAADIRPQRHRPAPASRIQRPGLVPLAILWIAGIGCIYAISIA